MKIKYLHHWDITYKEAVNIQQELKGKLILDDKEFPGRISTIAGADISYSKQDDMFFAAVILLAYPTMDVIEEICLCRKGALPVYSRAAEF